jgi:hypothetical protein
LFEKTFADSFTAGASYDRKIGAWFGLELFADDRETVETIDTEFNSKPVGILHVIAELDIHKDSMQAEPPKDIFSDVKCSPKPNPCARITIAPVDGMDIRLKLESVET